MLKRKRLENKFLLIVVGYLLMALTGLWFLTKSWLPPGFVIAGHDSGLALASRQFLISRLFTWDDHINFGQDNTLNIGSLTLHFMDFVLATLAGGEVAGNQISVFFWLALIFSSALIFSFTLHKHLNKAFVFIFPPFITFNFYIFQSMFMLERAKYGLFAATMLFAAITFLVLERKINILLAVLISSVIFFIFNGGSLWGLPLYGGFLIMIATIFTHTLIWGIFTKRVDEIKRILVFFLLAGFGYILINSYAILPAFVKFRLGDASLLFSQENIAPNKAWLDYISQTSSFINIFRLQGIPDWYEDQYKVNANHPYAFSYTTDKMLVGISFIFPILAFLSLVLAKTPVQKRLVSFFALMVLISMVFVSGTHAPLGFIYNFFYENVPAFAIFRTPFYKFGSVFFFGMIFLIAFSLASLIYKFSEKLVLLIEKPRNLQNSKKFAFLALVLTGSVIFSWLAYHKVLFSPQVFNWQKTNTTRITIPPYINDFKSWSETSNINGRILLLPPLDEGWRIDSYDWGYWSLSTLPSMLIFQNTVANEVSLTNQERDWLWEIFTELESGKEEEFVNLAKRLGIDFFLVRKDVSTDNPLFNLKSPKGFEDTLGSFESVNKVAAFGKWTVFGLKNGHSDKIYAAGSLVEIPENQLFLYRDFKLDGSIFLKSKRSGDAPDDFLSMQFKSFRCLSCLIETAETDTVLPVVRILPNSPLYALKRIREQTELIAASSDEEKINAYLGFSLRRVGEVKHMLDFREKEKHLVADLKSINDYLVIVYQILSSLPNSTKDFKQAKDILQVLHPIESNLRIEVDKAKSGTFSSSVISGMTDVLWQINRIKNLHSEILGARERWETEKVFGIELSNPTDRIFLSTSFLPFDKDGNRVFPTKAVLKAGEELSLEIIKRADNLLELAAPKAFLGKGYLSIIFNDLGNKFISHGYSVEQAPRGLVGCYYGSVKKFDRTLSYKIKVNAKDKDQVLKLFIREEKGENLPLEYFLTGQREVSIFPISTYAPFEFIYNPATNLDYLSIYVCTEDKELPKIEKISVHEIFSPYMVVSKMKDLPKYDPPKVSYEKISPVQYKASLEGGESPFILILNEKFDPLWKIKPVKAGEGKEMEGDYEYKHLRIDGYSNGWLINSRQDNRFIIEYLPQRFFRLGAIISATVLIVSICTIIFLVKRGKIDG